MPARTPPTAAVTISTPTAPPHWALLERELMRAIEAAIPPFYDRYFDERGYLKCFVALGRPGRPRRRRGERDQLDRFSTPSVAPSRC